MSSSDNWTPEQIAKWTFDELDAQYRLVLRRLAALKASGGDPDEIEEYEYAKKRLEEQWRTEVVRLQRDLPIRPPLKFKKRPPTGVDNATTAASAVEPPKAAEPEASVAAQVLKESRQIVDALRDSQPEANLQDGPNPDEVRQKAMKSAFGSKTAFLVIHGIGEQNPYETLDQFARNLFKHLRFERSLPLQLSSYRVDHNDWVQAVVRIAPTDPKANSDGFIDVHEYYWAPATEGKMKYGETLKWLLQTTVRAITRVDDNAAIQVEGREGQPSVKDSQLTKTAIVWREFKRIFMIYTPVLLLIAPLWAWLNLKISDKFPHVWPVFKPFVSPATMKYVWVRTALHWAAELLVVAMLAIALVACYIAVTNTWTWLLRRSRQQKAGMATRIIGIAVAIFVAATLMTVYVYNAAHVRVTRQFKDTFFDPVNLLLLASFLVAGYIRAFLKNFVADVAIYTNTDEKGENFAARQKILSGALTAIRTLLGEQHRRDAQWKRGDHDERWQYDRVIVAGHSLGSVVAYDALNALCNFSKGAPDQVFGKKVEIANVDANLEAKLKGLVTFGSPLDKVYYFFRDSVPDEQVLRRQVLSSLYSLEKPATDDIDATYVFSPGFKNRLSNLTWLNAWSPKDPISGALHFYSPTLRQEFRYKLPVYAHLSYWEDMNFYLFISDYLLMGKPVPPQSISDPTWFSKSRASAMEYVADFKQRRVAAKAAANAAGKP